MPTLAELAFLRLCTKALGRLNAATWEATWTFLAILLGHRTSRRVVPGARHPELLDRLARRYGLKGDGLVDGWLAALALEQGRNLAVVRGGGIGVDRRARNGRHRDVACLAPRGWNDRGAQLGVACEHAMEADQI